jgi:uncharacterized protein YukE
VKKRMRRGKKPVLTSPWKIGMFVSLLLVFMGVGVACYFVSFYHVSLAWLKTGSGGWSIDSTVFFKEAYPLLAGVVIISLISYFIVASAVRRYKFYLDSGQDYRTMISLAESIDDLTNPAQIARLSSYPELQSVLRSYGDQLREISKDLAQQDRSPSYDDLQSEIESLLRGESIEMDATAKGERTAILEKVRDHAEAHRAQIEELENRVESERRSCARAALAYGRVMEAISGAGEGLLAITTSVGDLTNAAQGLSKGPVAAQSESAGPQGKALKAIISDMEGSVRKLEDGGRVLHEFSEENNGIAINLALMAARGHVNEHDLATFAERVRSTAERFHKLSGTVSSIAQGLLGTCYALKEKVGEVAPAAGAQKGDPGAYRAIVEIARRIDDSSATLQTRICNLGSELHDVHEMLQGGLSGAGTQGQAAASPSSTGAGGFDASRTTHDRASSIAAQAEESPELVIDHGKTWGGMGSDEPAVEQAAHPEEMEIPAATVAESPESRQKSDYSDMSSLRDLANHDGAEPEAAVAQEQPRKSESWMEMPGHRWLKIDVEKTEVEEESGKIEVTVKSPAAQRPPAAPAPKQERGDVVIESAEEPPLKAAESRDNETVYDLFDLGAVEYVEETPARR